METERLGIFENFRNIPHQWVYGAFHLERDTSRLGPRQHNMLKQRFFHDCCFVSVLADELAGKPDVLHILDSVTPGVTSRQPIAER